MATGLCFLVDENVARLARWLRLIGYDTIALPGATDTALVERARAEGRVLLTRDRGIMVRRSVTRGEVRAILLHSDNTWQQLEQVVRALRLDPGLAPMSRCAACNGLLEVVAPEQARAHVPPFVGATQRQFTHCPDCGRYYWRGTHWRRVAERLARLHS